MTTDQLCRDLYAEITNIPLIDPHTHINPHAPAARNLDEILGYHYYTELAHSAGMSRAPLAPDVAPRERVRALMAHMDRLDNTAQYGWFLEIARTFLGFQGDRLTAADADPLFDEAERRMSRPDWEETVMRTSKLEKVFLTNDFDDPLEGFDTSKWIPCLRTDDLVFHFFNPTVRQRLAKATGVQVGDISTLRKAVRTLFEHFTRKGARACAISLPPDFRPVPVSEGELTRSLAAAVTSDRVPITPPTEASTLSAGVFWILAEHCREFGLPFDLMIGVNRRVYREGVYQGQDLFDGRMSLIQYAELFNAFPEVPFCVSVLSSHLNQELASYSWIFPNVITSGHWWYANIPAYIETDLRARLQAVPKTKQIGYYSDMYKLEFGLPKYNMYRRLLSKALADDFVRPGVLSESGAVALAKLVLRDNVRALFKV
jgi:glucuronate isomerase